MSDAIDLTDEEGLAEVAGIFLDVMRVLQVRLHAAETDDAAAQLTGALHKAGRSYRQTLALKARLRRDARAAAVRDRDEALDRKRTQAEAAVKQLIWTEYEGREAEYRESLIDERLDDAQAADEERFLTEPLEVLAARVAKDLGVTIETPLIPAKARTQAEPATTPSDTS